MHLSTLSLAYTFSQWQKSPATPACNLLARPSLPRNLAVANRLLYITKSYLSYLIYFALLRPLAHIYLHLSEAPFRLGLGLIT